MDASSEGFVELGRRRLWSGEAPFGFGGDDRSRHLYIIGKTGSGKTTMIRNLIIQDLAAGRPVFVVDPHGDLAEDVLDHVPAWRTEHVVHFDPADPTHCVGLDLFQRRSKLGRELVASGLVSSFKHAYGGSWGPRLEYVMFAGVLSLMHCENASVLALPRLLSDARYREWVVRQVDDPMLRHFWRAEFGDGTSALVREMVAPVLNKVGQLALTGAMRAVVGHVSSKVDFRFMMDDSRIFVANLSKGRIGEDKASLLGALLVNQVFNAALSRASDPASSRRRAYLYVDEFSSFGTDAFAGMLSEARKYGLCLTLAHQFSGQLGEKVRSAVFGNVGTVVSFAVSSADANVLAEEYGGAYPASEFASLAPHEVCVKLLQGGRALEPFLGRTLPTERPPEGRRDAVARRSRERYAVERREFERRLARWLRDPRR